MSDIVVLGPTGNVGAALTRLLVAEGLPVRTGNRQDFDYARPATYAPLFKGASHLFLLTPVVETMVELTAELLLAAKRAGVRRVVRLSAMGASPDSGARLLRWHAESERLTEEAGLPWTIVRPNAFMQNFLRMARTIRERGVLAAPAGDARVSFVDAADVAAVVRRALVDDSFVGRRIDVTGPEALSYAGAAGRLSAALGRRIAYADVPPAAFLAGLGRAGVPAWHAEAILELHATYRAGEAARIAEPAGARLRTLADFFIQHRGEL